jgi:hypothetical protein
MNHTFIAAVVVATGLIVAAFALGAENAAEKTPANSDAPAEGKKALYHVVSLKFKPAATTEQIGLVEQSFAGLKEKVPGIASLTWGTNVSPEKHAKGFTHCFVLTFASEKDRDAYLVHEDHKAFGAVLGPVMADVFVIDFWGK